jgi:hypothetical protein
VGVVGHRPDPKKRPTPDISVLRATCRDLLRDVRDTFGAVHSVHEKLFLPLSNGKELIGLRLICALAEGSDQWVACEAEKLGYQLQVVLPFDSAEYEKDFAGDALLEYQRLRGAAKTVFELDGSRDRANNSYLAAGRVILNQTDLLLAVWDGEPEKGAGGTGQIVREALQRGIPTLWVHWNTPAEWDIRQPTWGLLEKVTDIKGNFDELEKKVWQLLEPPPTATGAGKAKVDLRHAYFGDRRRSWTVLGGWWAFFRDLLRLQPSLLRLRVPEFRAVTETDWRAEWYGTDEDKREVVLPERIIKWVEGRYLEHYGWANQLSIYNANNYRSSFVWIYLLGALAVLLALIGRTAGVSHHVEQGLIFAEVLVICTIVGLTWYGRRRQWHERWIEYRIIAEQLRLARFNCLLGGVWQQVNMPSYLVTSGNNPTTTWMNWHARAVERAAGLPNIVVDHQYLSACRELLMKPFISGQQRYHSDNAERLTKVDHRLHRAGEFLFLTTLVACVLHLIVALGSEQFREHWTAGERWLTFGAAFMPALGAAMAAIRSQGELHRVMLRSRAMQEELAHLAKAIANVPPLPNELNSQLLQQASERASRLMYNEVLDWRIVFQDRPLDWPA